MRGVAVLIAAVGVVCAVPVAFSTIVKGKEENDDRFKAGVYRTEADTPNRPITRQTEPKPAKTPFKTVKKNEVFTVLSVIDGDTIKVKQGNLRFTVRIIGIDTPETKHPTKGVECMGMQASEYAKSQMSGKSIKLVKDTTQDEQDKYGRKLRHVILPNGNTYGEQVIEKGLAKSYVFGGIKHQFADVHSNAQQEAKLGRLGVWSEQCR